MREDGTDSTDIDDPIASALMGDSLYERLRVRRHSVFGQSIPKKLAWQSGLLCVLALVLPIAAAFPPEVKALFPSGDPVTASPQVMLLGVIALAIVLISATTLAALEYTRLRLEPTLTRRQAEALLNWEDVASLFGLGTGGMAVVITDGFVLMGLGGADLVQAYTAQAPTGAFVPSGTGVSVVAVAATALCGAVVLFTASRCLRLIAELGRS